MKTSKYPIAEYDDFANEGIRQADRIIDELDEFMKKLEDAGILSGWTQFMNEKDEDGRVKCK